PRADVLDHRQVVRDEDVGQAERVLKVFQQVDHLRLDREVERRDRLVADDQPRRDRECARDADPLALAAGELVRIAPHVLRVQADRLEQLRAALLELAPRLRQAVDHQRFADDRAYGHAWIQRRVGILENDLHLAADRAQRLRVQAGDVLAVEPDLARSRLDQPQDATARGRLAATRFAYEPERLAGLDLEAHSVDGVHPVDRAREQAAPDRKVLDQVLDAQQRL